MGIFCRQELFCCRLIPVSDPDAFKYHLNVMSLQKNAPKIFKIKYSLWILKKKYLGLKKYRNNLPAYIDFPYQTCK